MKEEVEKKYELVKIKYSETLTIKEFYATLNEIFLLIDKEYEKIQKITINKIKQPVNLLIDRNEEI